MRKIVDNTAIEDRHLGIYLKAAGKSPRTKEVWTWETPASHYPLISHGRAAIVKHKQPKGFYRGHKVRGFDFIHYRIALEVTNLQVDGKTWMIDEPNHWWLLQDIAEKLFGHVLVGGLGLGLILHAMRDNPRITKVTCIEREADVVTLVEPWLPQDKHREIIQSDFQEYLATKPDFDCAFVDLWTSTSSEETKKLLFQEVIPMAAEIQPRPMWALGFTGVEPIFGALKKE